MATVANQALTAGSMAAAPAIAVMNFGPPSYAPLALGGVMPAPATAENPAKTASFRFYDRAAKFGFPGFGETIWAYQNDRIFGLGLGLHHSITAQSSAEGFGLHTGLYVVDAEDGSRAYIVGLFRSTTATMGFVKLDLTTGVWSDGTFVGTVAPASFSTCVAYKGSIYHASEAFLTIFNPLTNQMSQVNIGIGGAFKQAASGHPKLRICRGRLFVIGRELFMGDNYCAIAEFVFGGVAFHARVPTFMDTLALEVFSHNTFPNDIWVSYEQDATEGAGKGMRLFQFNVFSSVPGSALPAPIDLTSAVDATIAPGGVGDNNLSEVFFMSDNAHTAHEGGVQSVLGYAMNVDSLGTLFTAGGHLGIDGFVPTFTLRRTGPPPQPPFPNGEYSRVASPNGTSEHFHPLIAFPQIQDMSFYSDGTVARGILIRFRLYGVVSTFPQLRFLFGLGLNPVGGTKVTLSVGDGITIGGSMTLDVAGKFLNTGSPTGNGPTLFSIIWDLDADSIPDDEWVLIRSVGFLQAFEVPGLLFAGPGQSVLAQSAATAQGATPNLSTGPVTEVIALTSGNPPASTGPVREALALTTGNPAATTGPVREITVLSSGSPAQSTGPVREAFASSDLSGADLSRPAAGGRPYTRGGGTVGVELDGGGSVGDRQEIDWSPAAPGLSLEPDSTLPNGPLVGLRLDMVVELGRVTVDAVGDAVDTTYPILDVDALGLQNVGPLKVVARAVTIAGLAGQPSFSLGTNGATANNQVPATPLVLAADDQIDDSLVLASPSVEAVAGDVITLRLIAQAAGTTTYSVEVIVYGYHRRIY